MAKPEAIGSGRRFRRLEAKLAGQARVRSPRGLAAAIGRRKFGKKRFQELARLGRERKDRPAAQVVVRRRVRV